MTNENRLVETQCLDDPSDIAGAIFDSVSKFGGFREAVTSAVGNYDFVVRVKRIRDPRPAPPISIWPWSSMRARCGLLRERKPVHLIQAVERQ
jgi:hypothetical protein